MVEKLIPLMAKTSKDKQDPICVDLKLIEVSGDTRCWNCNEESQTGRMYELSICRYEDAKSLHILEKSSKRICAECLMSGQSVHLCSYKMKIMQSKHSEMNNPEVRRKQMDL